MLRNTEPLGRFEYCMAVGEFDACVLFYERIGFEVIDGDSQKGWAVMKCHNGIVTLFQGSMDGLSGKTALNFRGGDVKKIVDNCKRLGLQIEKDFCENPGGGGYATLLDPDGNEVFLDTVSDEPVYKFNVTKL